MPYISFNRKFLSDPMNVDELSGKIAADFEDIDL